MAPKKKELITEGKVNLAEMLKKVVNTTPLKKEVKKKEFAKKKK